MTYYNAVVITRLLSESDPFGCQAGQSRATSGTAVRQYRHRLPQPVAARAQRRYRSGQVPGHARDGSIRDRERGQWPVKSPLNRSKRGRCAQFPTARQEVHGGVTMVQQTRSATTVSGQAWTDQPPAANRSASGPRVSGWLEPHATTVDTCTDAEMKATSRSPDRRVVGLYLLNYID